MACIVQHGQLTKGIICQKKTKQIKQGCCTQLTSDIAPAAASSSDALLTAVIFTAKILLCTYHTNMHNRGSLRRSCVDGARHVPVLGLIFQVICLLVKKARRDFDFLINALRPAGS